MKAQLWSSDEDRFIKEWPGRPRDIIAAFAQNFGIGRTDAVMRSRYHQMQEESETRREDDRRHSVDNMGRDHRQLVSNCMNMFQEILLSQEAQFSVPLELLQFYMIGNTVPTPTSAHHRSLIAKAGAADVARSNAGRRHRPAPAVAGAVVQEENQVRL